MIFNMKDVSNVLEALKNRLTNRQARTRLLAVLFLAFFLAVFLTAHITIIANANHECIGDGCPICMLIHNAGLLLKQIGIMVIAISVILLALFIMSAVMTLRGLLCRHSTTLVQRKVKLNI